MSEYSCVAITYEFYLLEDDQRPSHTSTRTF